MPFATDGKISLIDTEHVGGNDVNYHKLDNYLHPNVKAYWNYLIQHGGPPRQWRRG
jgi:hypothetical protein